MIIDFILNYTELILLLIAVIPLGYVIGYERGWNQALDFIESKRK